MARVISVASTLGVARCGIVALQDAECIRSRESTLACSSSYNSWSPPWGRQRCRWVLGKTIKVGGGMKARGDFEGFRTSPPLGERSEDLVCVIRGVNGASREGADSESAANDHPSTKIDHPKTKNALDLKSIIQEIEPLDISLISKDVSPDSADAMKRTISGMLGLLPSDQFQVVIESPREPLARLLVSSMMTGYTLRNGEYRLCLKRSLEISEELSNDRTETDLMEDYTGEIICGVGLDLEMPLVENIDPVIAFKGPPLEVMERPQNVFLPEELGAVSPEVANFIQQLQAKLATTSKELEECKHALTSLEMEGLAGEETNDLLDYLRSLEPEKVAELSQPTSPEVEHVINEVTDGLLANLCVDQNSEIPFLSDGLNTVSKSSEENKASEVLGNMPLQFKSNLTASRDYLARLLFWCMLLGHYMCAVEYRLQLSRTLSLAGEIVVGVERGRPS